MSNAIRSSRYLPSIAPRRVASSTVPPRSLRLTQSSIRSSRVTVQTARRALSRSLTTTRMSYSNADTGDKPADPYKAENKSEPELKEKIEGLVSFIESCKYGMMTTRIASSGLLVSRCMALAARVCRTSPPLSSHRPCHRLAVPRMLIQLLFD